MTTPNMTKRAFDSLCNDLCEVAGTLVEFNTIDFDDGEITFQGSELEVLRVFAHWVKIKPETRFGEFANGGFYVIINTNVAGYFHHTGVNF